MSRASIRTTLALLFLLVPALMCGQGKWERLAPGATDNYKGVCAVTASRWYAVGDFAVAAVSSDSGRTWRSLTVPTTSGLWGVYATAGSQGDIVYVAGDDGALLKSLDGGAHWTAQDLHYNSGFTFGIFGYDSSNCWVTGGEFDTAGTSTGVIVATHDGGAHWNKVTIAGTYSFDKCWFTSPMTGYAAGSADPSFAAGVIYKTTDGGASWTKVQTTAGGVNSIFCADSARCFAAGFNGVALRSNDAGRTWSKLPLPSAYATSIFTHVTFLNAGTGFMCGPLSVMLVSADSGATWQRDVSFPQTAPTLWTMATAPGGGIVLAVGDAGAIYRFRAKQLKPAAMADTSVISFDSVRLGESVTRARTLAAANAAGLRVDSIYIDGTDAHDFALLAPTSSYPITLAGNQNVEMSVRFQPSVENREESADLVIVTNDADHGTVRIPMEGFSKAAGAGVGREPVGASMVTLAACPLPAAAETMVDVGLPSGGPLVVDLCDSRGAVVRTLLDATLSQGTHRIPLDAASLPNGTYYCRARFKEGAAVHEIVVMH
ncbi:MAG TPA: YCF48-related protein [Candidatus Kapabacteria bacterium]|nr:YCF48-related protein [Candidatus Kapabacteria bacterium]